MNSEQREREHPPAAEQVGELAAADEERCEHDVVGVEHPRDAGQRAPRILRDARHRDVDDRGVDERHERPAPRPRAPRAAWIRTPGAGSGSGSGSGVGVGGDALWAELERRAGHGICARSCRRRVGMPANICASTGARIGRSSYVGSERYLSWREQPDPQRLCARLAASVHVELSQDRRDVVSDGLLGDHQLPGDLRVALTVCQ